MGDDATEAELLEAHFQPDQDLNLPQRQVILGCQIIVRFDSVLQGLHSVVCKTHGRVILLAELRVLLHRGRWCGRGRGR